MDLPWSKSKLGSKTYARFRRLKEIKDLDAEYKRLATNYPFLSHDQLLCKAKRNRDNQKKTAKNQKKLPPTSKPAVYDWKDDDFTSSKKFNKTPKSFDLKEFNDDSSLELEETNTLKGGCSYFMDLDMKKVSTKRRRQYNALAIAKKSTNIRNKAVKLSRNCTPGKVTFIVKKPVIIEVIELSSDSEDEWIPQSKTPQVADYGHVKIKMEKSKDDENDNYPDTSKRKNSYPLMRTKYSNLKQRNSIRSSYNPNTYRYSTRSKTAAKGSNIYLDEKLPRSFETDEPRSENEDKPHLNLQKDTEPTLNGKRDFKMKRIEQRKVPKTTIQENTGGFLCELFD
ncbi:hypothetical protein CHUAL_012738 [Chamberlinius hualienensis]